MSVLLCVCVFRPSRPLITSGIMWYDIDHVCLVKQVFTAFPCSQLLYLTLVVDKMDGNGLINTVHCEHLPKKTKVTQYILATGGLPKRQSTLVIKMSQ